MAESKSQAVRLTELDVAILDEIQRRTGMIGYSDAIRYAVRHYAESAGIDVLKPKPKRKR
jgi:hypothetical protein